MVYPQGHSIVFTDTVQQTKKIICLPVLSICSTCSTSVIIYIKHIVIRIICKAFVNLVL
jgi:hypothetical protein